uniref:Uncharacterized protein n=1 Tax=Scleropages formosus TaxID=113540 RepID=A0A8C9SY02_SCLFO
MEKAGVLSFTSITFTVICKVPDLGGFPPSTAVNRSFITGCFSRSNPFCNTNSINAVCSRPSCTSRAKCSFGLSL